MKKATYKKVVAAGLAATMVIGSVVCVQADGDSLVYPAPTSPISVNQDVITVSVHRAASVLPEVLGLNTKCGFSMINGTMPADLEEAEGKLMLGAFGSSYNTNPDPFYYNYFYNFYAKENNLPISGNAVIIPSVNASASPVAADTTILEQYGTSISLAGRPDILIGCASTNSGTDTDGYNEQIAAIRAGNIGAANRQTGDENYQPYLVRYSTETTYDMVTTLNEVAEVAESIAASDSRNAGKSITDSDYTKMWRYEAPTDIAEDFGDYVCGISTYVLDQMEDNHVSKQKVAVVQKINSDGTFTLADAASRDATSAVRGAEYIALVADNIAEGRENLTVSADVLLTANVIILSASNGGGGTSAGDMALPNTLEGLSNALGSRANELDTKNIEVIAENPDTVYGITMNSIENGMGFGYFIGRIYDNVQGVDINPVHLCAYFYEKFYHVKPENLQNVVSRTFANVNGVDTSLTGYSASAIETKLGMGKTYYYENILDFEDTALTKVWGTVPNDGIADGTSNLYDTDNDVASVTVNSSSSEFANGAATATMTITAQPSGCNYTVSGVTYTKNNTVTDAEGNTTTEVVTVNMASGSGYTVTQNGNTYSLTINEPSDSNSNKYKVVFSDTAGGHPSFAMTLTINSSSAE